MLQIPSIRKSYDKCREQFKKREDLYKYESLEKCEEEQMVLERLIEEERKTSKLLRAARIKAKKLYFLNLMISRSNLPCSSPLSFDSFDKDEIIEVYEWFLGTREHNEGFRTRGDIIFVQGSPYIVICFVNNLSASWFISKKEQNDDQYCITYCGVVTERFLLSDSVKIAKGATRIITPAWLIEIKNMHKMLRICNHIMKSRK